MRLLFFLSLLILTACSTVSHIDEVHKVLGNSRLSNHQIQVGIFLLTSYERVSSQNTIANIYIEGDGQAWLSRNTPSLDPTPKNPIALKLAALDGAENVIYLARPCQYTKTVDGLPCDQKYWTSHRFAPEVIEAMDQALNDVKQRHGIMGFNLTGFSGGGNVAALLAARRDDVVSIRTVAGNLDHRKQSELHSVSQMPESLNAKDIARSVAHIPQLHFIGAQDHIVPKGIYDSYKSASGQSDCVQSRIIDTADHTKGWESVWPSLLALPIDCSKP